ncbi:hypothetical protein L210DRAFT_990187 [Boletus edulis BED1]|uniref:Uncharacterized protein n=1 Tax=Boletus edulis BED1 TaxID=1328754 RepID=A0AAD4G887_BOLED|nr:hypothetical protein L210DRAFT_990187 [Boletus edulis BED1]
MSPKAMVLLSPRNRQLFPLSYICPFTLNIDYAVIWNKNELQNTDRLLNVGYVVVTPRH